MVNFVKNLLSLLLRGELTSSDFKLLNKNKENTFERYDIYKYLDENIETSFDVERCIKANYALTRAEAEMVLIKISALDKELKDKILYRVNKYSKINNIDKKYSGNILSGDEMSQYQTDLQNNTFHCPFLINSECSIKNIRPIICRAMNTDNKNFGVIDQIMTFVINDKYNLVLSSKSNKPNIQRLGLYNISILANPSHFNQKDK